MLIKNFTLLILKFKEKFLIAIIFFCFYSNCTALSPNDLHGLWALDEKKSSSPEKQFKGKLRVLPLKLKNHKTDGLPNGPYRERLADYEKQHLESQKRKSAKNLKRLGLLLPLINVQSLQIKKTGDKSLEFSFIYDNVLERNFKISATGRVYSAKGNELSENIFGYTLAYLEKQNLILETDTYDGHRVREQINLYAEKLNYKLSFQSFLLTEEVILTKLFSKKTTF